MYACDFPTNLLMHLPFCNFALEHLSTPFGGSLVIDSLAKTMGLADRGTEGRHRTVLSIGGFQPSLRCFQELDGFDTQ